MERHDGEEPGGHNVPLPRPPREARRRAGETEKKQEATVGGSAGSEKRGRWGGTVGGRLMLGGKEREG